MRLHRRQFLVGASASALLSSPLSVALSPRRRPNVLLLMSDQHKRSCMGAAGDSVARTPHLDHLAAESTRFSAAYCTNPVCTPSRASLLTGLYSHHLEAQNNVSPFSPLHKTMAHHFAAAGYLTGLIGKMHWVDAQTHGFDYRIEFNDWLQYLGPKVQLYADELGAPNSGAGLPEIDDLWLEEGDPWKGHRHADGRKGGTASGRVSLIPEQDHFDSFVARESVRFLQRFGGGPQPFFLITSFLRPHAPFMPSQRFADLFDPAQMRLPASWGKADLANLPREVASSIQRNAYNPDLNDPAGARRAIAFYYANLAEMDDCLGRVVQAVRDLGLENDTIICYTADHGEMLSELGLWQKFQFYEGSCGVPLLIRVPGRAAAVCDAPVSLVSLCSTLADLANVPLLQPNDGASLQTYLKPSKGRKPVAVEPVFAEYGLSSTQPKRMIRDGDWKFTEWLHDIPELYNLREDPHEMHNLASEPSSAAQVQHLKQRLHAWYPPFTASTGEVSPRLATELTLNRQENSSTGLPGQEGKYT
jgi:choline-sulfatase